MGQSREKVDLEAGSIPTYSARDVISGAILRGVESGWSKAMQYIQEGKLPSTSYGYIVVWHEVMKALDGVISYPKDGD